MATQHAEVSGMGGACLTFKGLKRVKGAGPAEGLGVTEQNVY